MLKNIIIFIIGLCIAPWVSPAADYPPWWHDRGVIDTNAVPNDYAPVTAGQLKWMATQARDELEYISGWYVEADMYWWFFSPNINQLIESLSNSNNYSVINLGQLKATAKPFYDYLNIVHTNVPPWTENTTDDNNFAVANIGQLKSAFNFDLSKDQDGDWLPDFLETNILFSDPNDVDSDHDGIADTYEYWDDWYFGYTCLNLNDPDSDDDGLLDGDEVYIHLSSPCSIDTDGDGLTDAFEVNTLICASPTNSDTDGDLMPDEWEYENGMDVCVSNSNEDSDLDGLDNLSEFNIGTHPLMLDTDGDGIGDGDEVSMGSNPLNRDDPPSIRGRILNAWTQSCVIHIISSPESNQMSGIEIIATNPVEYAFINITQLYNWVQ